jgi:septal ring-binding cell division protein DamX
MAMTVDERGKITGGPCDPVKGGYTIFLDEERMRSFLEGGDFSSGSELDHFMDVGAQIEKRVKERGSASFLALAIGERGISRDFAVLQIAHLLAKHGKSVLIVDCDFLHPGLSGLVENIEEHGFLDLLLYGSSLKTVAKPVGIEGVSITGPGSFPVSRTIPFALKEFGKIQEFLRTKHDVVIYCSTLYTEDAKVNPLASEVDGIVLCCRIEEMGEGELEKNLKNLGAERVPPVELVCFCAKKEQAATVAAAKQTFGQKVEEAMISVARKTPPGEKKPLAAPVIGKSEELEPLEAGKRSPLSIPRLAGIAGAVFVVAFIVWWMVISKTVREQEPQGRQAAVAEQQESSGQAASTVPVAAESLAAGQTAEGEETAAERLGAEGVETTSAMKTGGPARPGAYGGADTLTAHAPAGPARYTIHVSSFKEMSRAEVEKAYLEENGFSARIVDTDIKGVKWLRVFVGGYATMEEASKARLDLLGLPKIGYARIVARDNEAR